MLVLSRKDGQSVVVVASGCEALFTVLGIDGDHVVLNRHDMCPLRIRGLRLAIGVETKVQVGGVSFGMKFIKLSGGAFKLGFEAPDSVRILRTDCVEESAAEAA
ncbi:MAG: hypothetical protein U0136_11585 [Bdellovibrionota bacterium]